MNLKIVGVKMINQPLYYNKFMNSLNTHGKNIILLLARMENLTCKLTECSIRMYVSLNDDTLANLWHGKHGLCTHNIFVLNMNL